MPAARITEEEFIRCFEEMGPRKLSQQTGIALRAVYERRRSIEGRIKRPLVSPQEALAKRAIEHPSRLRIEIDDGVVLVGSDAHYWPGLVTTAHRAFVRFARELQPKAIIMNGDALDGARVSRHAPIGWETRPELVDEIETVKQRLGEIERAAPNAKRFWPLGNHDARFETRLATVAPEYARVHGVHLKDHVPHWHPCWSTWINDDTVVKHRWKSGIHAPHNNTIQGGATIITGHLHSLKVQPWSDYRGTRFGVDCGALADTYGRQFTDYTEDSPRSWRSGFAVLTFHRRRLLWPELVHVIDDGVVEFRGRVIEVPPWDDDEKKEGTRSPTGRKSDRISAKRRSAA